MRAYSVEFFTEGLVYISNYLVNNVDVNVDYLAIADNQITLPKDTGVYTGCYIRITHDDLDFFGVVKLIEDTEHAQMVVTYTHFLSKFDQAILFDTDLQGTDTLESNLATIIDDNWISNSDSSQNITGLTVTTTSSTSSWGFNLKSDTENMHHCIVNFLSTFIYRSMEKYYVGMYVSLDLNNQIITLSIGTNSNDEVTIEADLPSVISKSINIKQTNNSVNKLIVWNTEDYSTSIEYYLHSDGTYDSTDSDRITPVVCDVQATAPEYDSDGTTVTTTFATNAESIASETFGSIEYNNLIELEILNDDSLNMFATYDYNMDRVLLQDGDGNVLTDENGNVLVYSEVSSSTATYTPYDIGQKVNVISNGVSYSSILTGKKVGNTTTLIFGTVRLDLTKILKRGA